MKVHAIACVSARDLFWGCEEALEWLTSYSELGAELTQGVSMHTLVSTTQIERRFINRVGIQDKEVYEQSKIVMERLHNLPTGVLIDLEN
jgi:hypothetical protein